MAFPLVQKKVTAIYSILSVTLHLKRLVKIRWFLYNVFDNQKSLPSGGTPGDGIDALRVCPSFKHLYCSRCDSSRQVIGKKIATVITSPSVQPGKG